MPVCVGAGLQASSRTSPSGFFRLQSRPATIDPKHTSPASIFAPTEARLYPLRKFDDIPIPFLNQRTFPQLRQTPLATQRRRRPRRFLFGEHWVHPNRAISAGYGHLDCRRLLAIQEVKSLDTQLRHDLDYGAIAIQRIQ